MAPVSTAYSGTSINEIQDNKKSKTLETLKPQLLPSSEMAPKVDIIDIRHDAVELSLKDEILSSLQPQEGPKRLPTLLLYNEKGLQIFEEITYLEEYYLTNAEIEVLNNSASKIAETIPSGSMLSWVVGRSNETGFFNVLELTRDSNLRKSSGKIIDYYALDLSLKELHRTLEQVPNYKHVKCHGLHGTYDDGLDWLKTPENIARPKCVLSLGSSIGNFSREGGALFLKGFSDMLQSEDSMLVGLDATSDPARVYVSFAYKHNRFILNGLTNANDIYQEQIFQLEDWKVIGEYVFDIEGGRHQAFISPVRDVTIKGIKIKAGERLQIEESLKYSPEDSAQLWKAAGLVEVERMSASNATYMGDFDTQPKVQDGAE
ncbi:uncharacterized protein RSE6_02153 [Rhynchosporium secalis]|uniref:4-dimethylallyltryptophan N-methyltransferase n=1 Tax=Rhynchosporium secalis TaxID=38038 RepID=A0A1E1LZK5_RHYSE|nr:uncharacterized protein RSE6_02153 [Rhynchosporium secalis]